MTLAVVGGSGLDRWPGAEVAAVYGSMTDWGEASAAPRLLAFQQHRCLFLPRHGDAHQVAPHAINYRANIAALKSVGATAIVGINAVGGIAADCVSGALVLPHDLVDYTWGREHTYFTDGVVEHVEFAVPYDAALRRRICTAAQAADADIIDGGVYAATQGPRLETAAEIVRLERDGCTVVGMTGMPEAALARELDVPYAALCLVVNPAAGRGSEPITMAAINRVIESGMVRVRSVLQALIRSE